MWPPSLPWPAYERCAIPTAAPRRAGVRTQRGLGRGTRRQAVFDDAILRITAMRAGANPRTCADGPMRNLKCLKIRFARSQIVVK
jgi:hypothetical protein